MVPIANRKHFASCSSTGRWQNTLQLEIITYCQTAIPSCANDSASPLTLLVFPFVACRIELI